MNTEDRLKLQLENFNQALNLSEPARRPFRQRATRMARQAILASFLGGSLALAGQAQDETVYWARPEFIIPFQIDANGTPPREVILEASEDDGMTWYVVSRGDTRTRQFRFQAPHNGVYMFRLKMVDDAGRKFNNPGDPLRINVDTEKPTAKLVIQMDQQGDLVAKFRINDQNLDVNSLKLEFQSEESQDWQRIQFEVNESDTLDEWTGTGTWSIPRNVRQIVVRLIAKDKAGNTVEVTRAPDLPKTAMNSSGLQFASQPRVQLQTDFPSNEIGSGVARRSDLPRVQVLGQSAPQSMPPTPSPLELPRIDTNDAQQQLIDQQQKLIQQLLQQKQQAAVAKSLDSNLTVEPTPVSESRSIPMSGSRIELRDPDGRSTKPPFPTKGSPQSNSLLASGRQSPVRELTDEEFHSLIRTEDQEQNALIADASLSRPSVPINSRERQGRMDLTNGPTAPLGNPIAGSQAPMFSGSHSFSLEYGIENDAGAAIRNVELWGTTDGGTTWDHWGDDPDRTSPFDIEVESDGLFGFRMVIVGANGLATNRPRSGDDADAWVQVDTSSPRASIQSALYGRGAEAGSMIIEYRAEDPNFGERPISLYYGDSVQGPWQEIATNLRNTGRYVWTADPNLPPSVYLKLRVVDAAGNPTDHVMDVPVKVQGIVPRGRIRNISPGLRTN